MHFSTIIYRSDLVIPGTKSSLYVEEFFEFSDKLSGPGINNSVHSFNLSASLSEFGHHKTEHFLGFIHYFNNSEYFYLMQQCISFYIVTI